MNQSEAYNKNNIAPIISDWEFRDAFRMFPTGVSIVSVASTHRKQIGVTINSLCSVSLSPPLILFCLKKKAKSYSKVIASCGFMVNLLAYDQQPLAKKCTQSGGAPINSKINNSILIDGCLGR